MVAGIYQQQQKIFFKHGFYWFSNYEDRALGSFQSAFGGSFPSESWLN